MLERCWLHRANHVVTGDEQCAVFPMKKRLLNKGHLIVIYLINFYPTFPDKNIDPKRKAGKRACCYSRCKALERPWPSNSQ